MSDNSYELTNLDITLGQIADIEARKELWHVASTFYSLTDAVVVRRKELEVVEKLPFGDEEEKRRYIAASDELHAFLGIYSKQIEDLLSRNVLKYADD